MEDIVGFGVVFLFPLRQLVVPVYHQNTCTPVQLEIEYKLTNMKMTRKFHLEVKMLELITSLCLKPHLDYSFGCFDICSNKDKD